MGFSNTVKKSFKVAERAKFGIGTKDIDRGAQALYSEIKKIDRKPYTKVGVLGDAAQDAKKFTDSQGNTVTDQSLTVVDVATFNEFGTETSPARPVFRNTVDERGAEFRKMIDGLFDLIIAGKMTVEKALNTIGVKLQAAFREKLTKGPWEPNTQATIDRKGSSRPLIDTGQYRQSINYEVVDDGRGE